MRTIGRNNHETSLGYKCGSCLMMYCDYKQLVEHLYWRHGTESYCCKQCTLKRWHYAAHICNVLPIDENYVHDDTTFNGSQYNSDRETEFCFCGKYITGAKMIGCDGPKCTFKWYHFTCVGIVIPPDGDWLCPQCTISQENCAVNGSEKT